MTIEVRQMVVKSAVLSESPTGVHDGDSIPEVETLKADILAACRQLVREMLREVQER